MISAKPPIRQTANPPNRQTAKPPNRQSANPPIRQSANWRKKRKNVSTAETQKQNF
jgi:hypothetical protein